MKNIKNLVYLDLTVTWVFFLIYFMFFTLGDMITYSGWILLFGFSMAVLYYLEIKDKSLSIINRKKTLPVSDKQIYYSRVLSLLIHLFFNFVIFAIIIYGNTYQREFYDNPGVTLKESISILTFFLGISILVISINTYLVLKDSKKNLLQSLYYGFLILIFLEYINGYLNIINNFSIFKILFYYPSIYLSIFIVIFSLFIFLYLGQIINKK